VIEVSRRRFEELVADGLDAIPDELYRHISNVAVMVEEESDDPELLGEYIGIPLTERFDYSAVMPDRINIYRGPLTRMCSTEEEIVEEVTVTVIHEIAHHFGIDDERLHELGWG
jgi:predicted Zn-dependent protease with MMP-like domain